MGCDVSRNDQHMQIENLAVADSVFASPLDSLEWLINRGTDEQKMDAMIELNNKYRSTHRDVVFKYAKKEFTIREKGDDWKWKGVTAQILGDLYFESGKTDSCLLYFNQSLSFYEKSGDEESVAFLQKRVSIPLLNMLEYDQAIDHLLKALDYYEKNNKPNSLLETYNKIALVYETMGNIDKQEEYLLKSFDLSKKEDVQKNDLGIMLINLALLKRQQKEYDKAEEFGKQAIEVFRQAGKGYERLLALSLQRMYFILMSSQRPEHVKEYLDEAITVANKLQNRPVIKDILLARASYYLNVAKDYPAAFAEAKKAEAFVDSTNLLDLEFLYYELARSAVGARNKEEGFKYLESYYKANNKKQNKVLAEKSSEMEVKYETEKKQLEIEKQQLIIGRQNAQRNLLASGVVLSILILFLLWYLLHLRSRRNLALTERNDALLEMNATKDKFFSIISHDLKNPAIAQRDAIQMLANNGRSWSVDALTEYYSHLLKSADSQVELLYNLLNWAQVQTGRISYTPVEFNLSTRLRTDLSLIGKMAENKGITFTVEMPDDALITGDPNMLITIIRNLLTNAVKFTSAPGEVSLTIKPVAPFGSAQGAESKGPSAIPAWG
jgi:tetratricopeptide (TPR) repeat protein